MRMNEKLMKAKTCLNHDNWIGEYGSGYENVEGAPLSARILKIWCKAVLLKRSSLVCEVWDNIHEYLDFIPSWRFESDDELPWISPCSTSGPGFSRDNSSFLSQ
jgi:hypothetical protein